jgi:hypothetical protein
MKITVNQPLYVVPPKTITIELTEKEARVAMAAIGAAGFISVADSYNKDLPEDGFATIDTQGVSEIILPLWKEFKHALGVKSY